ncbi:pyridoxal phosphate-dependent decarboxylase family protein [Vibrio breoganii]|uniref:pyridoxal phosphate-dependent decarboxylase family protein n=1 Tax=Vibrio breoganii TaxID=553239 RepID=UPI0021C37F65|nr:pyridoxal-dependent decarboxylase [Vibrio breoganii]MDN3714989.1 pyridoxal-dependent decarboxylase [Vibrio breoganii]
MKEDRAETEHIEHYLTRIGKALDTFLHFDHEDALCPSATWQKDLSEQVPQQGVGIDNVIEILNNTIIPNGSAIVKPGFTAYITTGATTVAALANTAASVASPQRYTQTAFNYLEELSLDWLADMFYLNNMKGVYSSGGSVANLIALGGARQFTFEKLGIDVAAEGITKPVTVYASSECHHTIQRSMGVLGLGRRNVVSIDTDPQGRLLMDDLKQKLEKDLSQGKIPMAIVASAGTTNRGAIDPLFAMGTLAREHGIWFHVDGAYGLPGILDERVQSHYKGLELADSVITDPHKWLGASVGIAATFVNDRELLARAFTQEPADYLEGSVESAPDNPLSESQQLQHSLDSFGIPFFDYSVELSAPCRGVVVWSMLKEIGVQGMRERIKRHNDMATQTAQLIQDHPQLELLGSPELSICCFRFNDLQIEDLNAFNQRLHRQLIRENCYLPSTTKVNGKLAIRPCYLGARTESKHVIGLVEDVVRIGRSLMP